MSRAKALLEYLDIASQTLSTGFLLSSRRQRVLAPQTLSLPRLGPLGRAAVLRPLFSALRGGTLTDVDSIVITKRNATFVRIRNSDAYNATHTRGTAAGTVNEHPLDSAESMTPE